MTPSRVGCVVNPASGSGDGERMARDGAHTAHDAVHYRAAESVTVRSGEPLPVEADGTPLSPEPRELRLGVEPGGLTLARSG